MSSPQIHNIFIASDHAGFLLKQFLIEKNQKQNFKDLGVFESKQKNTYPRQAFTLCQNLLKTQKPHQEAPSYGVLLCGSGQGMAIQANRFKGIRAALGWSEENTRLAREHNNCNVLCLGARLLSFEKNQKLFHIFITTAFKGGRHIERVKQLDL